MTARLDRMIAECDVMIAVEKWDGTLYGEPRPSPRRRRDDD